VKNESGYECSAVDPPAEIDFDKPSPPNVNGSICKIPESNVLNPPWDHCKRWRSYYGGGLKLPIAESAEKIDSRIIVASMFLIIIFGLATNLSIGQINSYIWILLIILIAIANIGYIYARMRIVLG
jgi:hypothetical protein